MKGAFLNPPDASYIAAVDRVEERSRLQAQAQKRKSMLIFGPEGVGKTRLLQAFVKAEPLALYVPQIRSPRHLMFSLIQDLRRLQDRAIRLPDEPRSLSTPSLKGIVDRALATRPFLLVLDHIAGPSRLVTGAIRQFTDYGKRPILFAARSPHMEDIGALRPLCADRSERLELKPFPCAVALEFASREAQRAGLSASNIDAVLHSLIEWSEGNPGAILQMLKMAAAPRYRTGDQIKAHVLYLDFRMGRQQLR